MTSTYEIIKALPAKGFDWAGFVAEMRTQIVAGWQKGPNGRYAYCNEMALADWDNAKGMRAIRESAMVMANSIVSRKAARRGVIQPSEETLAWGGFLGGSVEHWTDEAAEKAATQEIAELAERFRKAR